MYWNPLRRAPKSPIGDECGNGGRITFKFFTDCGGKSLQGPEFGDDYVNGRLSSVAQHPQDAEQAHVLFDLILAGFDILRVVHSPGQYVKAKGASQYRVFFHQGNYLLIIHSCSYVQVVFFVAEGSSGAEETPGCEGNYQDQGQGNDAENCSLTHVC